MQVVEKLHFTLNRGTSKLNHALLVLQLSQELKHLVMASHMHYGQYVPECLTVILPRAAGLVSKHGKPEDDQLAARASMTTCDCRSRSAHHRVLRTKLQTSEAPNTIAGSQDQAAGKHSLIN